MKKTLVTFCVACLLFGFIVFAEDKDVLEGNKKPVSGTGDIVCIKNAIEIREGSILAATDIYRASWTKAFTARTSAFLDAISKSTKKEITSAMNMSWWNYKVAIYRAKKTRRTTVQNAWTTYRTSLKSCNNNMVNRLKEERGVGDLIE